MTTRNQFFSSLLLFLLSPSTLAELPAGYQSLSAQNKLNILWNRISAHPFDPAKLPLNEPGYWDLTNLLWPSYDAVAFTHVSDETPEGRMKVIHHTGSTAKVELKITNPLFTGIFNTGGIGLARLSLAKQDYDNYPPGMGVKILIDGQRSQNIHVMYSLDTQGTNKNFFANDLSNIIPPSSAWSMLPISWAFNQALTYIEGTTWDRPEEAINIGLYEQAAVMANGTVVTRVKAPYVILFEPNPRIGWNPKDTRDLRIHLNAIPAGTRLYTVYARSSLLGPAEIIGELVTTSGFVASLYEDQSLYFQHACKRWRA